MKYRYAVIAMLIMAFVACTVGCNRQSNEPPLQEPPAQETEEVRVKYVYKTKYLDFEFISDEEKESWRPALVSLLNNKKTEIYQKGGDLVGYSYLYPDRPCIENGYYISLFDINVDGTPELLVNVGGGSAGNALYIVYDIMTGERIGTLDGGYYNSWCIYLNQNSGNYEAIGQFEWRCGWTGKDRFVNKATLTSTVDDSDGCYLHEVCWMHAYYAIDSIKTPLAEQETDQDGYYLASWEEIYTGVHFDLYGDRATIEDYFDAQDEFEQSYVRIAETGIRLIDWDDVTSKEDDVATKAEKMADALLSSDQKFLKPLADH